MNKEQAEKLAKIMREAGVDVRVMKCGSEGKVNESISSEDALGAIAKEFMEAITKKNTSDTGQSDQLGKADKDSETKSGPTYANHAFKDVEDLASRVNLFVEHPMMVNLSTVEVNAVLSSVDQMLSLFEEHNTKFMGGSSEDACARVYLNAIFYAVDLIMKTKADAGLLSKPDASVKVSSAE